MKNRKKSNRRTGHLRVGDLEVCQEFRVGDTWYRALLPPLLYHTRHMVGRWCLNLTTLRGQSLDGAAEVDELR
jgi:hypothetical protein